MDAPIAEISGRCDPKFAGVRDTFSYNFRAEEENGAAFAVTLNGRPVIDLWGGFTSPDQTKQWAEDTLVNVWSSTKGVNAACYAILVSRRKISYEDKVSAYWPEFGAAGKQDITIGTLLSHQAGVCGFTTPATTADLYKGEEAAARLAAQAPIWPPGTASGYHAISIGILSTALFQRIEGRSIKQFVHDEIATPLGVDFSIGLDVADYHRAAEMSAPPALASSNIASLTAAQIAALANPSLDPRLPNTDAWRAAELPSANGFSNARALAAIYAKLLPANDGCLLTPAAFAEATRCRINNEDLVLNVEARWAAGFTLNSLGMFGPNTDAFGHSGWGGSFGFADPQSGVTIAYVMNRMGDQLRGDPRGFALVEAVYAAL